MCFKIKAEHTAAEITGLMVENNVCLEDSIGVSLGGAPPAGGLMYKDATIRRNVFSQLLNHPGGPTTTCLGVDISSCEGADISSNYFLDTACNGSLGITIQNFPNTGISITGNVFKSWTNKALNIQASDTSGITNTSNWVERPVSEYVDGSRSVAAYATSQGYADADALILAARQQTKVAWHVELSGSAITDYVAAGFTRP